MFYKTNVKNRKETQDMYKLHLSLKTKYVKGYYVYGRKFSNCHTTTKDIKLLTNYIARYASSQKKESLT